MRKTTYGSSKILKLKSLPLDMAATLGGIMCWVCQRFVLFLGGKCKANYRQIWWMSSCDWDPVAKHGHMAHAGLFASSTHRLSFFKNCREREGQHQMSHATHEWGEGRLGHSPKSHIARAHMPSLFHSPQDADSMRLDRWLMKNVCTLGDDGRSVF